MGRKLEITFETVEKLAALVREQGHVVSVETIPDNYSVTVKVNGYTMGYNANLGTRNLRSALALLWGVLTFEESFAPTEEQLKEFALPYAKYTEVAKGEGRKYALHKDTYLERLWNAAEVMDTERNHPALYKAAMDAVNARDDLTPWDRPKVLVKTVRKLREAVGV